jgi:hypothetical protein
MQTISRIIVPQIHFCRNIFCTQYSREKLLLSSIYHYFFSSSHPEAALGVANKSKAYNQKSTFSEMDIRSAGPARTQACEQGVQVPLCEDD